MVATQRRDKFTHLSRGGHLTLILPCLDLIKKEASLLLGGWLVAPLPQDSGSCNQQKKKAKKTVPNKVNRKFVFFIKRLCYNLNTLFLDSHSDHLLSIAGPSRESSTDQKRSFVYLNNLLHQPVHYTTPFFHTTPVVSILPHSPMRSLIKGHRRSDSSFSDSPNGGSDMNPKSHHRYNRTPQASPKVASNALNLPQMTPPHQPYLGSQLTLASPKKLLTPIKKMFGHHSSKNNAPLSGDVLHSALAAEGPPRTKRSPTLHSPRSMSSLNDLSPRQNWAQPPATRPNGSHIRHLSTSYLYDLARIAPPNARLPGASFGLGRPFESSSSVDLAIEEKEDMAIMGDHKQSTADNTNHGDSDSNLSIAKSINFLAKQASSQENLADGSSKFATDDVYDEDSSEDSDNSSQFSFVKDIRGGRNTSVKYYKTKSSKKQLPDGVQLNTFDVEDFGYEDDGLSDYDFENNGLDDDEEVDDFENKYMEFQEPDPEEGHMDKYEDMLDENDMRRALLPPPPIVQSAPFMATSSSSLSEEIESDSKKADISEMYVTANLSHNFLTPNPEDQSYDDDVLETYMENTKLPTSDVHATPHQRQQSFSHIPIISNSEMSSPLINGVTFGLEEFKYRQSLVGGRTIPELPVSPPNERAEQSMGLGLEELTEFSDPPKRNLIMDLLGALEGGDPPKESEKGQRASNSTQDIQQLLADLESRGEEQPNQTGTRRELIVNMMDTLANLAQTHEVTPPEEKKEFRRSVTEMMNSLAALDLQNSLMEPAQEKAKDLQQLTLPQAIQSEKSYESPRSNGYLEDNSTERYHLDEDMLFECNQLPEDYDLESYQNQLYDESVSEFYRSNSYNKKPKKVIQETQFRTNKIETPQRTVTFYRSNSLGNSDNSNSGSLSRSGTVYSATSFTSGEEEQAPGLDNFRQKTLPYALNINFQLNERSSDCLSHKSFNLEPINEGDSPHVK